MDINYGNLKVLVVDDSRVARSIVQRMLHDIGVDDMTGAEDGAAALETLQSFEADLVICDLNMAPLDGIEFTKLVRDATDSPNPYVPIIMLTAEATETQLNNALKAGVNDLMSKPVQTPMLRHRIAALLGSPIVFVREDGHLAAETRDPPGRGKGQLAPLRRRTLKRLQSDPGPAICGRISNTPPNRSPAP